MSARRRTTPAGRLARIGFADATRAERLLSEDLALDPDGADAGLLAALAAAADPDLALVALARMPLDGELLSALRADAGLRSPAHRGARGQRRARRSPGPASGRLAGAERARTRCAARRPRSCGGSADGGGRRARTTRSRRRDPAAAGGGDPATALPAAYRRRLLHLAARDLTGTVTVDETAAELADLAAAALEAALAIARSQLPAGSAPARLAVIAMGKCGGRELNYASDVDVIFVGAPAAGTGAGTGGPGPADPGRRRPRCAPPPSWPRA